MNAGLNLRPAFCCNFQKSLDSLDTLDEAPFYKGFFQSKQKTPLGFLGYSPELATGSAAEVS
jgi:hypothetical protein